MVGGPKSFSHMGAFQGSGDKISIGQDSYEPIMRIRQKGLVMEDIEEFEIISGPLRDIDCGILKGMFLNGLKDEL